MKKNIFLFILLFILMAVLPKPALGQSVHIEHAGSLAKQAPKQIISVNYNPQEQINSFLRPVQFSKVGVENFFTQTFNTSLYSERFLPSCFIHVVDFLEYGTNNDKPPSYFESVFSLFHQRLKESSWVNPYALISFFERLPEFLEFLPEQHNEELKETLREELESALLSKFELLKNDPDAFLTQTADILLASVKQADAMSPIKNLQNSVVRFLEGAINKLIWNPQDKIDIWKSIKLLAKKCELLYYYGIVGSMDDVNQLIWSLLYRFGYFINCTGSQLKPELYHTIRAELKTQNFSFLKIAEQEQWMTSKTDYLNKILTEGEIKSHAYEQGILSDFKL